MRVREALERVDEAVGEWGTEGDRRAAYERTLWTLRRVAGEPAVTAVAEWVVGQARETGEPPTPQAVRRRAAVYCRANDVPVPDGSWLRAPASDR
jgi:hypothetical protein